jgi:hypothetical protein
MLGSPVGPAVVGAFEVGTREGADVGVVVGVRVVGGSDGYALGVAVVGDSDGCALGVAVGSGNPSHQQYVHSFCVAWSVES